MLPFRRIWLRRVCANVVIFLQNPQSFPTFGELSILNFAKSAFFLHIWRVIHTKTRQICIIFAHLASYMILNCELSIVNLQFSIYFLLFSTMASITATATMFTMSLTELSKSMK